MKITHMTVESTKGWANIARREVAGKAVIGIRGDGRRANRYFLADGGGQGHARQSRTAGQFLY